MKTAFEVYDFIDEDTWIAMLNDRNSMGHVYDGNAARKLVQTIIISYIPAFCHMRDNITAQYREIDFK